MPITVFVASLVASGCDKGAEQASDGKAKAAEPAKVDAKEPSKPDVAQPDAAQPDAAQPDAAQPDAAQPAGPGFVVGPALATNDDLEGMVEGTKPLHNAGATVSVSAHSVSNDEGNATLHLRARVEFEGADASAGLNHERKAADVEFEQVFLGLAEIAKLPDGRWLVDAQLSSSIGEDSISTTTDHSVLVIDPNKRSAALLWSGVDTSQSDMGVCMTDSQHSFAVAGEKLVVSKTEGTEFDAELGPEVGMSAADCKVVAKATSEVAQVELAPK